MLPRTFESTKKNWLQNEREILDDSAEPTSSIKTAQSWFEFVQRGDATPAEADFLFKEWMPKIAKAVLSRKYDWKRTDFHFVCTNLQKLLLFATDYLRDDQEGTYQTLKDLLDANQVFYSKHCPLATDKPDTDAANVPPLDSIDSLNSGDYLDCLRSDGKWEIANIEEFSSFRTEFQVRWESDGKKEWLSFEKHRHRMATFGTMSMNDNSSSGGATAANDAQLVGAGGDPASAVVIDVTDMAWKEALKAGDLVDAKDSAGMWYQACIMEVKTQEVVPPPALPAPPGPSLLMRLRAAAAAAALDASDRNNSLDDMYGGPVPPARAASPVVVDVSAPEPLVLADPIDFTDDVVEPKTGPFSYQDPAAAVQEGESAAIADASSESTAQQAPTAPAGPAQRVVLRVAFIGMPQSNDEWIDITSDRIQKLNSCSFGRRGRVIGVREEILHLVNTADPAEIPATDRYATVREGSFLHPQFVAMVNAFGERGGFEIVLRKLHLALVEKGLRPPREPSAQPSAQLAPGQPREVQPSKTWSSLLMLIAMIGPLHRALRGSFLADFGPAFIADASALLGNMSLQDVRESSVEAVEAALTSLELIAFALYGRNATAGAVVEPLRVSIALQCLHSPFLNRRLGALKMLSELVRSAEMAIENPTGWKVTRITMSNGVEDVTYRVVPVLLHLTLQDLCAQLRDCPGLEQIFVGDSAHESLMARAHSVVAVLASARCLETGLLTAMCTAGFTDNKAEALQCLTHVIARLPLDDAHVENLLEILRRRDPGSLTSSVVEIAAALALRCRDVLLRASNTLEAWREAPSSERMDVDGDIAVESVDTAEHVQLHAVFVIHGELLQLLWSWMVDGSGVPDAVCAVCVEKLEGVLGVGMTLPAALKQAGFPWAMQWFRTSRLVEAAVHSLSAHQSMRQSLKVLQLVANSWPHVTVTEVAAHIEQLHLPFLFPTRGHLMPYLERQFGLIALITSAAVWWNDAFLAEAVTFAKTTDWGRHITGREQLYDGTVFLGMSAETALNKLKIGASRSEYLAQLSQFGDFLHMMVRCADSLEIPQDTIVALYRSVMSAPVTADAVDTLVSFLHRIVVKISDTSATSSSSTSTGGATSATDSGAADAVKRCAVSSRDTVLAVFTQYLCDTKGFIASKHFSLRAFQVLEKWFRWLNSDISRTAAAEGTTDVDSSPRSFRVTGNPSDLVGIEVFPQIVLCCHSERVAAAVVKFLTTLPQTLSQWGRNTPSAVAFRNMLLTRCMADLSASAQDIAGSAAADTTLSRALLFLDGILEESLAASGSEVVTHGTIGRGTPVTFKVTSTHKPFANLPANITLYTSETVHDLFSAVAKLVGIEVGQTKIFRLGKEVSFKNERTKTIGQLHNLSKDGHEHLVVTKFGSPAGAKPAAESVVQVLSTGAPADLPPLSPMDGITVTGTSTQTTASLESIDTAEADLAARPAALVLAQTPEYFDLLVKLLQRSHGAVCDRLWGLLTRIPTSAAVLQGWVELQCRAVADLLLSFDKSAWSSLNTLLYNLQVVEVLLQPAVSAQDFEDQRRYIKDIDHDLLMTWVDRFVAKGGVPALVQAADWVQQATLAYVTAGTTPPVGVTAQRLHTASALVAKLLRAFVVHDYAQQSPVHAEVVGKALTGVKNDTAESSTVDAATATSVPIGPMLPKDHAAQPPAVSTATALDAPAEQASTGSAGPLAREWGWRIQLTRAGTDKSWLAELNVSQLRDSILSFLISLRQLSHDAFFHAGVLADNATRTLKGALRDALVAALDSLSVIWTLTCSLDATDAPSVVKAMSQRLVDELLLGRVPGVPTTATTTEAASSAVGQEWTIRMLTASLACLQELAERSLLSPAGLTAGLLGSELMQRVLERRPPLNSASVSNPIGINSSTTTCDPKPLFALANVLLEEPLGRHITLPVEIVRTSYLAIYAELVTVSVAVKAGTDPGKADLPIGDTAVLFSALCQRDPDSASFLHKQSTVDFLIQDCLGLVGLANSSTPCVCTEDKARKAIYGLLGRLVAASSFQAVAVHRAVLAVHQQVPVPVGWEVRPQREGRSPTGYVGLRNLGSTCYMNSLLQVLYMTPSIREHLLHDARLDVGTIDELRNNVAFQLKKLFYALKHSQKKFIVPTDWTFAFKDETGINPMNVMLQQDAQEFLQQLAERFEQCVRALPPSQPAGPGAVAAGSAAGGADVMHGTFGGLLCNQMFQTDSSGHGAGGVREIREQNEGFVCISVAVKGCSSLEASLAKFVEGEQIAGYQWDELSTSRVNITKRQCIARLPDMLIFHLKRFELNFDTFRREKVNDAFSFPQKLNMFPYTKHGLERAEGTSSIAAGSGVSEEDCEYELTGVVVHTGTAESGHYFAYLREPTADPSAKPRWLEFNDAEVTVFQASLLETECFGGVKKVHDLYGGGASSVVTELPNPKSAYMLIYSRVAARASLSRTVSAEEAVVAPVQPSAAAAPVPQVSVMDLFRTQIALENANHALSMRVLSEPHFAFYNRLMDTLHSHSQQQSITLTCEQLASYVRFTMQHMARTAHISAFTEACKGVEKYLASEKALAAKHGKQVGVGSPAHQRHKRSFGTISSPAPSPINAVVPPPPGERDNKENEQPSEMVLPPPPPPLPTDGAAAPTSVAQNLESSSEAQDALPTDELIASWLVNVDDALAGLYAPREEVRKGTAEVVLRVYEVSAFFYGKDAFSSPELEMAAGLLSTSFGAGLLLAAAATITATNSTNTGVNRDLYGIPEVAEAEPMDEVDPDLLLAIKMSQETGGISLEDTPVPTVAEAVAVTDAATGSENTAMDVVETTAPAVAPVAPMAAAPTTSTPPARHLLAPMLLLALTDDKRMQLIAEHWRRSQSVLWLLLEIARLGPSQRAFMLKREVVAQLVDALLGDQCPLNGMVYAQGSRRRAPSSYVTIVPGRDGSLPFAAKNIPDWTHLIELLSSLVCSSDSLQLGASLGEVSHQCVQAKTLYNTIFRQARYTTAAVPMLRHLSFENKAFSDLIGESLCDELGQSKEGETAHLFETMAILLNIGDTLQHSRCMQLFGAGEGNLLEIMKLARDQPLRHRFLCVFVRSFIALVENVPALRPVVSDTITSWAPWMLKFCFRFAAKCAAEQSNDYPEVSPQKSQVNQAIRALGAGKSGEPKSVSFQPTPTICLPAGPGAPPPPPSLGHTGPFVRVYGENVEEEGTQTWAQRADRTNQALNMLIISLGASPDALIPTDTFDADPISVATSSAASTTNLGVLAASAANAKPSPQAPEVHDLTGMDTGGMADGMTDEELAQYLATIGAQLD